MSRNSVLWMQHEESYVHKVEIVHQTEVSCSNWHDTHYMKIREVYDTYGYKEPGRVVCELCGTTFRLMNPTLEEWQAIKSIKNTSGTLLVPLVLAIGVLLRWMNGPLRNCFALIVGKNR